MSCAPGPPAAQLAARTPRELVQPTIPEGQRCVTGQLAAPRRGLFRIKQVRAELCAFVSCLLRWPCGARKAAAARAQVAREEADRFFIIRSVEHIRPLCRAAERPSLLAARLRPASLGAANSLLTQFGALRQTTGPAAREAKLLSPPPFSVLLSLLIPSRCSLAVGQMRARESNHLGRAAAS